VAIRGPHHCDVDSDVVESDDAVHPASLDWPLALKLHAKFDKERGRSLEVVHNDADMVHPLDRHVPSIGMALFGLIRLTFPVRGRIASPPVIFDPPPKSRRRAVARFLWPTLIIVAVVVAVVVTAAGEETRIELAYLDEIRSQAGELARSGSIIDGMMSRIAEISREEFTTAFDGVTADLEVAVDFVADEPPTESLIPVWSLYRQAVQAWSDGVDGLTISILQAADDPEDDAVIDVVGDALADLRAGDNIYQNLQSEFDREEFPEPVAPLADVAMSPTDTGLFSQTQSYVNAARRSTNGLGLRPGLRISQVVAEPEWEINIDREAVVPTTDTIVFTTVITNAGNIASEVESVQMTLRATLEGDSEPVAAAAAEVPPLQPNGQTTVEFSEVQVVPGTPYRVTVELILTHPDSDPADNLLDVEFTVNPS
jgi:hypothetical protein